MLVMNLDPAAEYYRYKVDVDVQEIVSVSEIMEATSLGPNGGLLKSLEYIYDNFDHIDQLLSECCGQDDILLVDCPGQIELYSHSDIMPKFIRKFESTGFHCVGL